MSVQVGVPSEFMVVSKNAVPELFKLAQQVAICAKPCPKLAVHANEPGNGYAHTWETKERREKIREVAECRKTIETERRPVCRRAAKAVWVTVYRQAEKVLCHATTDYRTNPSASG